MRYEIRLAGSGGQGVILAGIILAEAGVYEKLNVANSQNYGPETRGGTSNSDIIFSDSEIDYPKALKLDLLVALTQRACDDNIGMVKEDGLVLADPDTVIKILFSRVIKIPVSRKAQQKFNDPRVANMLTLGALSPFCPWVSTASIKKAIQKRLPPKILDTNLLAFEEGIKLGRRLKTSTRFSEVEGAIEV
jgi:2-oxoglutarate ferredoxin oxidoreductase subunit gamma